MENEDTALLSAAKIGSLLVLVVIMSISALFTRSLVSDIEVTISNTVPYLVSATVGTVLAFLYLTVFPSQRNSRFFTFVISGAVMLVAVNLSGAVDLWLVNDLMLYIGFIFGGHELVNTDD